ncbi:T9SS type A sorting domain-containing protein, partial [candidate division KSB1 bacterium]|nr:T9SS type A sorting domain-containing protein [candidate division KSB1 bacterium]
MKKLLLYHEMVFFSIVLIIFVFKIQPCPAASYYVDPQLGNINNNGDREHPWNTLEDVFKKHITFTAGDYIYLLDGHHGAVVVRGTNNADVNILPLEGHKPTLEKLNFSSAGHWIVSGLIISPQTAPVYTKTTLVNINNTSSQITVKNCFCYSVFDNSIWNAQDWSNNSCSGASIQGRHNIISRNHFLNVKHGILVESDGSNNLIEYNVVENFAADGMRGIGSFNIFEYNTVKNCYDVDDNHDDGFQSYSYGPDGVGKTTVYGIVLRGNTIINYTDPGQPFRGTLQGIGCFDGMFEDWIIENNVIVTDHWHGISLYGARNCKIINNTVVDRNDTSPGPPWIKITAHKDGTQSSGNIVRNNLTTDLSSDKNMGEEDHNLVISRFDAYDNYFLDYEGFDLRLRPDSRAIDAGSAEEAPGIDKDGNKRPQGNGYDLGAYEYVTASGDTGHDGTMPSTFTLNNYPNPFTKSTKIEYYLPLPGVVQLTVYNTLGEKIQTLVHGKKSEGPHSIQFNAKNLPSGIYFCKI